MEAKSSPKKRKKKEKGKKDGMKRKRIGCKKAGVDDVSG
jgi:hypothetical protein